MRILIIEDDRRMSRSIELILKRAGLEYETAGTGEDGIEFARICDYDAILLDLALPGLDGYEVLRCLRGARIATPVIILTGNKKTEAKVLGLGLGADDYVTKPFQSTELLARVYALVRRSNGQAQSTIKTGSMSIDLAARTVEVSGNRVALTGKEYGILEMLSLRKGMTLTKEMFATHLYSGRGEPQLTIIDVFICKLRKKLSAAGSGASGCIETVWGQGYALRDPKVPKTSPRST